MSLRPYGEDYLGFSCISTLSWFSQSASLCYELKPEDHRGLAYLSAISPGWPPILSATGLGFTFYCVQRVRRQFGLDQEVPGSLKESVPSSPSLAPFIKDRAFAYWKDKVNRMMVPCGHRLGFNIVSMNAYWQRLAYAMVGYVKSGRGNKVPLSNHYKSQISSPCFSPPSQSAIAYGNSQKLGFAEWDETRSGWIAYTTYFPEGWRESVNVVKERLAMPFKRGKWAKKDAPVDSTVEKSSKNRAHSQEDSFKEN